VLSICHVLWSVEVGGAERVVLDLARAQRAAGHDVAVLTLGDTNGRLAPEFRSVVATFEAVPKRTRGLDPVLPLRLGRWFRRHGTDVVHTHNELPLIYAAPGAKLARLPVVHSKHGIVPVKSRGAHLLRRAAARAVDAFVAVSDATAATAIETGECTKEQLRVVINGTDLSRFPAPAGSRERIRAELGIPSSARALITVGRLVKEKNHALLLRSAAPLLGEERRLILVGDGALREELHALVRELKLARWVHMTGSRQDVPELLAAADAWVLSSDSEGLPIGLIEAWGAGLPVVATAVGGIPAALSHEETGLLVEPRDEVALRNAMDRVITTDVAALAENGRSHALATYSAEKMAAEYESLYESARR
jgi:glycosyltransferase involved in cell wall biosynthesis